MKIFKITSTCHAVCQWENTRNGFRHVATLTRHGDEIGDKVKASYQNRTWESYQFESVLKNLLDKNAEMMTAYERKQFKAKLKSQEWTTGHSL